MRKVHFSNSYLKSELITTSNPKKQQWTVDTIELIVTIALDLAYQDVRHVCPSGTLREI